MYILKNYSEYIINHCIIAIINAIYVMQQQDGFPFHELLELVSL